VTEISVSSRFLVLTATQGEDDGVVVSR